MPADQAEIVGEYMAVKFVAELSAQCTATSSTDKSAEDRARDGSESDTERAGNGADGGTSLAACKCCTDAACCTANRTDGSRNFHCLVERGDFGGVTARALQ
jgi:hypothetical protein